MESGTRKSKKKTQQRERWTTEEDNLLRLIIRKYGKNWREVAQNFPDRNPNSCIQRWKRLLGKNKKKKKKWTIKEDYLLQQLVEAQGNKWNQISKYFKGKSNKQCMERYNNCLNPKTNRKTFTKEEDEIIYQNYINIGSKWATIAMQLNGRTQNQVKNRFYSRIISSNLELENPYYSKLSSQQQKEELLKARLEHKRKLLLGYENLNNKEMELSQLDQLAQESQSFQVEEDNFSNFYPLK